jgi:hypothetical protein
MQSAMNAGGAAGSRGFAFRVEMAIAAVVLCAGVVVGAMVVSSGGADDAAPGAAVERSAGPLPERLPAGSEVDFGFR